MIAPRKIETQGEGTPARFWLKSTIESDPALSDIASAIGCLACVMFVVGVAIAYAITRIAR
jgi:hypothetical protein